ncbi:hypothetical protein O5D80_002011 [Batrachochytrium dendrobatidis]|nr:hypothetical protein O5D80_002011 [Batrachochytrium dendrobatidis]
MSPVGERADTARSRLARRTRSRSTVCNVASTTNAKTVPRARHSSRIPHSSSLENPVHPTAFYSPTSHHAGSFSKKPHQGSAKHSVGHHVYDGSSSITPLIEGFHFKRRRERLNWRMLASVNVEKIMEELDIDALQDIMKNITFCDIEAEDLRCIDSNFVKLFQLSQLIVEFLLHSQDFLVDQRNECSSELELFKSKYNKTFELNEKLTTEAAQTKKEMRALRKTLYAYQLVAKLPGGISQNASIAATYHRCIHCTKSFTSQHFLDLHMQRRHNDQVNTYPLPPPATEQVKSQPTHSEFQHIADMIERFSNRLVDTERQLKNEAESKMEDRINKEINEKRILLEDIYKQERLKYEKEIQEFKALAHRQIAEEREILIQEKSQFQEYMNIQLKKTSHVGAIEDDEDQAKISLNTDREQEELERKKNEQDALTLTLSTEIGKQQQYALATIQDSMAREMNRIQQIIVDQQVLERKAINERLENTSAEIQEMHSILMQQQQELANAARNKVADPPVAIELPKVSSPRTSIVNVAKPLETLTIDTGCLRNAEEDENDTSTECSSDEEMQWEKILKVLSESKESLTPSIPWVKSFYKHNFDQFQDAKNKASTDVDFELAKNKVTMKRIYSEWDINPELATEYSQLSMKMSQNRFSANADNPMLGRMRQHLTKQLDDIVANQTPKAQDIGGSVTRRTSIKGNSETRPSQTMRSIHISPVAHLVEIFDKDKPVTSSTKSAPSPIPNSPAYYYPEFTRLRHLSVATTATDVSETEDQLRYRLANIDGYSPTREFQSTPQTPVDNLAYTDLLASLSTNTKPKLKLTNPFKGIARDISKRLFSPISPKHSNDYPPISYPLSSQVPPSHLPSATQSKRPQRNNSKMLFGGKNTALPPPAPPKYGPPPPPPKDLVFSSLQNIMESSESETHSSYESEPATTETTSNASAIQHRESNPNLIYGTAQQPRQQNEQHAFQQEHLQNPIGGWGVDQAIKPTIDRIPNTNKVASYLNPDTEYRLADDNSFTLSDISDVSVDLSDKHLKQDYGNDHQESSAQRIDSKAFFDNGASRPSHTVEFSNKNLLGNIAASILSETEITPSISVNTSKTAGSMISSQSHTLNYVNNSAHGLKTGHVNQDDDDDISDVIDAITDMEKDRQKQQAYKTTMNFQQPPIEIVQKSSQYLMDDVDDFDD